ncbi:hypothetical protein BDV40DRAFT_269849 [Aspergillus tamarii]|uniref:Uncharacterized protein n=1 Tax=Aspergillus tamarii TaxID=41984 RepID=A0A5N6UQK6_ASPTM|nr:hypothetical protein BDV40DRAFT_269849 [Aspergillus tamarii]
MFHLSMQFRSPPTILSFLKWHTLVIELRTIVLCDMEQRNLRTVLRKNELYKVLQ